MRLSDFDYDLPEGLIALRPAEPRDAARLLVVGPDGALQDRIVRDLPDALRPGDVMVFNDTRVIPARLFGWRERADMRLQVEVTLLKRTSPEGWTALARPGRRLKPGDRLRFGRGVDRACAGVALDATVQAKHEGGEVALRFDLSGPALDDAVREIGVMPLPPYIAARRGEDARDAADYQTVYGRFDGSVAAPTAGLHFTPELLAQLEARGIEPRFVTLHVGAGTFLPVKTEAIAEHRMHAEYGQVTAEVAEALNAARAQGRRIVAVGTTSLRLLESALDEDGRFQPFAAETDIFITPRTPVRSIDALMTNFHLPKSTLIMLLAAFAGLERVRDAYAHAVAARYRFYSYGDAGLWWRPA